MKPPLGTVHHQLRVTQSSSRAQDSASSTRTDVCGFPKEIVFGSCGSIGALVAMRDLSYALNEFWEKKHPKK